MNNFKEFKDIIGNLEKLNKIGPSDAFRMRLDVMIDGSTKTHKASSFILSSKIAFASILVFFLTGGGIIAAAESAVPGNALYPVKNAIHKAKLAIASNPEAKALLHLETAEQNIADIEKSAGDLGNEDLDKKIDEYSENVGKARSESGKSTKGNSASVVVEEEISKQTERLKEIESVVPTQAQSAIERAIEASENRGNQPEVRGAENLNSNSGGNQNNDNSSTYNIGENSENRGNKK